MSRDAFSLWLLNQSVVSSTCEVQMQNICVRFSDIVSENKQSDKKEVKKNLLEGNVRIHLGLIDLRK